MTLNTSGCQSCNCDYENAKQNVETFFSKIIFFGIVFILWLHDLASASASIISSHLITESSIILAKYLPSLKIHVAGFQIYFFSHMLCLLHSRRHLLLFNHWFELHFLPSNLHFHSRDICLVNVFDLFMPVIMSNLFRFKSSFLVGILILIDTPLRVLQPQIYLSNLTASG